MEPLNTLEHIKKLPKAQDMADLQAKVDCLLKENGKLKSQVVTKEVELKEMGALKAAAEAELVGAWRG